MITIRDDQLTLAIANEQGFVDWYVNKFMPKHLTEYYQNFDENTKRKRTKQGRAIALHYGFKDAISQVQFVAMMWRFAPHFYRYPGFWEITQKTDASGSERIRQYYELSDDEFTEAVIEGKNSDWFSVNKSIADDKKE